MCFCTQNLYIKPLFGKYCAMSLLDHTWLLMPTVHFCQQDWGHHWSNICLFLWHVPWVGLFQCDQQVLFFLLYKCYRWLFLSRITTVSVFENVSVVKVSLPLLSLFFSSALKLSHSGKKWEWAISWMVSWLCATARRQRSFSVVVRVFLNVLRNPPSRHTLRLCGAEWQLYSLPLPPCVGFVHWVDGQLRGTAGQSLGGLDLPPWHASQPASTLFTPVQERGTSPFSDCYCSCQTLRLEMAWVSRNNQNATLLMVQRGNGLTAQNTRWQIKYLWVRLLSTDTSK